MKRFAAVLALLAITFSAHAEEIPGMGAFLKKVAAACKRQDVARLQGLQYESDVTPAMLKADNDRWQRLCDGEKGEDRRFQSVTFTSLQEAQVIQTPRTEKSPDERMPEIDVSRIARDFMVERSMKPQEIEGRLYEYNLKTIGFVGIFFTESHQQIAELFPVGIDPEGGRVAT